MNPDVLGYYRTLGVSPQATADTIKQAYREQVKRWHPDRNPSVEAAERFQRVQEAYEVLSDPQKRQAYDQGQAPQESTFEEAPQGVDFVPCQGCGQVTPHVRVVGQVLWFARQKGVAIWCPTCAARNLRTFSLYTLFLGVWFVFWPVTLLMSLYAITRNAFAFLAEPRLNLLLLQQQAVAYLQRGDLVAAHEAALNAVPFSRDDTERRALEDLMSDIRTHLPPQAWNLTPNRQHRSFSGPFFFTSALAAVLVIGVLWLGASAVYMGQQNSQAIAAQRAECESLQQTLDREESNLTSSEYSLRTQQTLLDSKAASLRTEEIYLDRSDSFAVNQYNLGVSSYNTTLYSYQSAYRLYQSEVERHNRNVNTYNETCKN